MKSLGIVRPLDGLGRIVLPIELRHALNLEKGDSLEIFTDKDTIVLRKYQPACIYCGNARDVVTFHGHVICQNCIKELQELQELQKNG